MKKSLIKAILHTITVLGLVIIIIATVVQTTEILLVSNDSHLIVMPMLWAMALWVVIDLLEPLAKMLIKKDLT